MPTAATLRLKIEDALAARFPAALTPVARTVREVASTGIPAVDALLDGGLPVGAISEVVGPASSGRTSLTLAFVARQTAAGAMAAWIDCGDSLDPESAAASGVGLRQLLWVRCREGANPSPRGQKEPWSRLDQALRATDLLLQAGGFAVLVLDLGSVDPPQAMRIPLATWFRFRQAADRARCSLVVVGRVACAQSSAALVLDCSSLRLVSLGKSVLGACNFELSQRRQRFTPHLAQPRKQPVATWTAPAAWASELPWSTELPCNTESCA